MNENFNTYISDIHAYFWRQLCESEGQLLFFHKDEEFVAAGTIARYIGFIKSGTLKYVAYSSDNTEHVVGLVFAGEFVADFPFSLYGEKSIVTIVAESDCEIYCEPVKHVADLMEHDISVKEIVMKATEALFSTVYDRYVAMHTQSPQQRYNDLISKHPDLFLLFPLKDIASFLNISPTHLSRLRRNIG